MKHLFIVAYLMGYPFVGVDLRSAKTDSGQPFTAEDCAAEAGELQAKVEKELKAWMQKKDFRVDCVYAEAMPRIYSFNEIMEETIKKREGE